MSKRIIRIFQIIFILSILVRMIDMHQQINNLEEILKDREGEIKALKQDLNQSNQENERLNQEVERLNQDILEKDKIIKESESRIKELEKVKIISMEATAYTDDIASQGKWVGQTATGMKPQVGVVAVDPKVIPLGTKLYVEGYGEAIAGDTGGAIKGNRIDLFMATRGQAMKYGRRKNVKVRILD